MPSPVIYSFIALPLYLFQPETCSHAGAPSLISLHHYMKLPLSHGIWSTRIFDAAGLICDPWDDEIDVRFKEIHTLSLQVSQIFWKNIEGLSAAKTQALEYLVLYFAGDVGKFGTVQWWPIVMYMPGIQHHKSVSSWCYNRQMI